MNFQASDLPADLNTVEKLFVWALVTLESSGASQVSVDDTDRTVSRISTLLGKIQTGANKGETLLSGRFRLFLDGNPLLDDSAWQMVRNFE